MSVPPAESGSSAAGCQGVLVPALAPEGCLHSPDRQERSWRDAIALLDRGKQGCIRMLERAPARHDGRAAALGEKLIKGQAKAFLATVSRDGCRRIGGVQEGCKG